MRHRLQPALERAGGGRAASARGRRPRCRFPRTPPFSLSTKALRVFAAFGSGLGNFAGLLIHFLEHGRGASLPRFEETLFPASFSTRGSLWQAPGQSAARRSPQTGPVPGGSPPTQDFLQKSGGKRDRARKGKKHEQKQLGSPQGLPVTWQKQIQKNYFKIQILYILHTYLHMMHNLKYVLVGF